jgi:hypothetical protein
MNSDVFARSVSDNTAESEVVLTPEEIKAALMEREQFRVENALLRMAIDRAGGDNKRLQLFLEEVHILAIEQSPAIQELVKNDILVPLNGSQMSEQEFTERMDAIREGREDGYKARHAALFETVTLTPVGAPTDRVPERPYRNAADAVAHLAEIGKA